MSPLIMGARRITAPSVEALGTQTAALDQAIDAGGPQLDPTGVTEAQRILEKVRQRSSLAGNHTVVALAGATGSGKSSLFNALAGADLATIGARRPTTSTPTAAVWGEEPAADLLDWLSVDQRHAVTGRSAAPGRGESVGSLDGLVLLDLPDFDSRELDHRAEAQRVLAVCDVFVWVTDPQKYADALLHDDYVKALSGHDAVMLVVLNQTDRLSPESVRQCQEDLGQILRSDGVRNVQVLTTSAVTGAGVPELRQRLSNAVAGGHAARQRLSADVTLVAGRLRRGVADTEPEVEAGAGSELVDALCRAAGVPIVLTAVEEDYRREAVARSGWLFTRWRRHLKADPFTRLRLDKAAGVIGSVEASEVRALLGRSSIPAPSPAARSAVRLAARDLGDRAGAGLPVRWAQAIAEVTDPDDDRLDQALDQAVVRTSLRAHTPMWWRVMGILQWALGLALVTGLVWLVGLAVIGWLQLPPVETPRLGPFAYPVLLVAAGIVLGPLAASVARALGRRGAVRRREIVRKRLESAIEQVATARLVAPVRQVVERHAATRTRLDAAQQS